MNTIPTCYKHMSEADKKFYDLIASEGFAAAFTLEGIGEVFKTMPAISPYTASHPVFPRVDVRYEPIVGLKIGHKPPLILMVYAVEYGGGSENYVYQVLYNGSLYETCEAPYDTFKKCVEDGVKDLRFLKNQINSRPEEPDDEDDDEEYDDNPDFEDFVEVLDANEDLAEKVTLLKNELNSAQQSINQKIILGSNALALIEKIMRLLTATSKTHAERNEDMLKALAICMDVQAILKDTLVFNGVPKDTIPF